MKTRSLSQQLFKTEPRRPRSSSPELGDKDMRQIENQFFLKLHTRYNQGTLQSLFTVDTYADKDSSSIKVKCMPTSYPNAVNAIDTIYKVFNQMYIDSKRDGMMNIFVCDFLQDAQGRFHFIKIHDFGTDGKPTFSHEWKLSNKFVDRVRQKEANLLANQVCEAKLICKDEFSKLLLERSCVEQDFWVGGSRLFSKVKRRLLTKYAKEIEIGCDGLSMSSDNKFDISPFYPLLAFPQRENKQWAAFEKRVL